MQHAIATLQLQLHTTGAAYAITEEKETYRYMYGLPPVTFAQRYFVYLLYSDLPGYAVSTAV